MELANREKIDDMAQEYITRYAGRGIEGLCEAIADIENKITDIEERENWSADISVLGEVKQLVGNVLVQFVMIGNGYVLDDNGYCKKQS